MNESPPLYCGGYHEITEALCEHLAAEANNQENFPLKREILVPSRSAATAITRSLIERWPAGFAGLTLHTLDHFARTVVNASGAYPRVASEEERRLAMRKAVEKVVDPMLDTPGIESSLERTYRDLRDSGITLTDLKQRAGRSLSAKMRRLIEVWHRYEANLQSLRAIDPADLLRMAAEATESKGPEQILFGFYDITGAQRGLVEALFSAGRVRASYFPIALEDGKLAHSMRFAASFLELLQSHSSDALPLPKSVSAAVEMRSFSTTRQELREVCRSTRRLLDQGVPLADIGIVCRSLDPLESSVLDQLASEFGFRLTDRNGIALRAQRIGRSVLNLLRIRENSYPRSAVIELLRDGFQSSLRSQEIDRLDLLTRKYAIAGGNKSSIRAMIDGVESRNERAASELRAYESVVGEIEELTKGFDTSFHGERWQQRLRDLLDRFRAETEEDLSALERVEEMASLFATLAPLNETFDAAEVAASLERAEPIVPRLRGDEVWYGDLMTMRGRTFPHLFLFGANEDRIPQRRTPDPLVPDEERQRLGLPVIGDGRKEEELLFQIVKDAPLKRLVMSYAESDGFGRILRPSPYLRHADHTSHSSETPTSSHREARINAIRQGMPCFSSTQRKMLERAFEMRRRGRFDGYLSSEPGITEEIRRRLLLISPTHFEDFGECPQKFLFRRLLFADELEDPEHEPQINYLDKGRLDHRILERFYRESHDSIVRQIDRENPVLSEEMKQRLARVVEEEFANFDREFPPFNATIRKLEQSMTAANLERFIGADLVELMESGFRPAHYEYSFGTDRNGPPAHPDTVALRISSLEVAMKGTIDRIDRAGAENSQRQRLRVVDYKSGKAGRYTSLARKLGEGHRLQLALYALAVEEIFGVDSGRISGVIKPLGAFGRQSLGKFTFELGKQKENLLANLELYAEAMMAGFFPAFPSEDACRYCPMSHSCRTAFDPEEQRLLREFGSVLDLLQRVREEAVADP